MKNFPSTKKKIAWYLAPKQSNAGQKKINSAIWQMTWPLLLTSFIASLIGLADMYLSGFIGGFAQAAVGIGEQVIFLFVLLGVGTSVGGNALISQAVGAGRMRSARLYANDSLLAGSLVGLFSCVLGVCFADQIFILMHVNAQVAQAGASYLRLCSLGNLPFLLTTTLATVFRACGRPRYSLYMWLITSLGSIALAFVFTFIWSPVGTLSVMGLALSWDISACVGVVVGMILFNKIFPCHHIWWQKGSAERIIEIFNIGFASILGEISWIASNFFIYMLVLCLAHATEAQAAWSVALKLEETFASMPLIALGQAVASLVGQNIGAGKLINAARLSWQVGSIAAIFMIVIGCAFYLSAPILANCFSGDPLVRNYVIMLLHGAPLALPLLAFAMILCSGMEGAGSTSYPMAANLLGYIAVRLPSVYLFALVLQLEVYGLWLAIIASRLAMSLAAASIFASGAWLKEKRQEASCVQSLDRLPRPLPYLPLSLQRRSLLVQTQHHLQWSECDRHRSSA